MTPAELAALHALCFDTAPRPWTAAEFAEFLDDPTVALCALPHGFGLLRIAGPEAEILTIAVAPDCQRQGIGRRLMAEMEATARAAGATDIFLEVAETNVAAAALYAGCGFVEAGYRLDYYRPPRGNRVSARVLRRSLTPNHRATR